MPFWSTLEDEIDYLTSAEHVSPFSQHVLIYYVPGNPGYIEYYRNFLQSLTRQLSERHTPGNVVHHQPQYHVHGRSLTGFQWQAALRDRPCNLDEIKAMLEDDIDSKAAEIIDQHGLKQKRLPVILIGHSIGAWLSLEAVAEMATSAQWSHADPQGAVLLFPTIVDIAKSPNGRRLGWLIELPYGDVALSVLAKLLFFFIPTFVLTAILQLVLSMGYHSALVTASFLKSPSGVRQALHMARDEFRLVRDDQWSDTLWGVQPQGLSVKETKELAKDAASTSAKLFFFWGDKDHWVADRTRAEVIDRRARTSDDTDSKKPLMEVDTTGLPHAFAVTDAGAALVARKAATWIREVVQHTT